MLAGTPQGVALGLVIEYFRVGSLMPFVVVRGRSVRPALAALVVAACAFALTLAWVRTGTGIARLDPAVTRFAVEHRSGWLTAVMRAVTRAGSGPVMAAAIVAAGLGLRRVGGSWRPLGWLAAVSLGAALLDAVVKAAVARPRPSAALMLEPAPGYAFPSGHTVQAVSYGALAWLLVARIPARSQRIALWTAALATAGLVGASRVYLGAHWASDVIGGWALGAGWLGLMIVVARRPHNRPRRMCAQRFARVTARDRSG